MKSSRYPTLSRILATEGEWRLLASASDPEGVQKMIARFWFTKPEKIALKPVSEALYDVYQDDKKMDGFRVIFQRKRFRFEGKV